MEDAAWSHSDHILDLNRRVGALEQIVVAMLAVSGEVDAVEKLTVQLGANALREPGMEEARVRFDTLLRENFADARRAEMDRGK